MADKKMCDCGVEVEWREIETNWGPKNKSYNADGAEHFPTCGKREEILQRLQAKKNSGAAQHNRVSEKLADLEARIIMLENASPSTKNELPF